MRWTVLVPLRALPHAKSRLAASVAPDRFEAVVTAIRADTIAAARAADSVERVVIVGDAPDAGGDVAVDLVQRSPGLNGALRDAAAFARRRWPDDGVVALVGDLPALRSTDLEAVLERASSRRAAFVADAEGTGTTLLTAAPGTDLDPRFGAGSAARHASVATPLEAEPSVRHDVDTGADLAAALRLGVGPATASAAADGVVAPRSP